MGLAVLLSACGFQLRGTGTNQLTITELDVSARNAYGDTVRPAPWPGKPGGP